MVGSVIAIDAYTSQCELRSVTNISSSTLTVSALKFAHSVGDAIIIVNEVVPVAYFGLLGDGSDEWAPLQRLFREAQQLNLLIAGTGSTFYASQPLLVDTGTKINNLRLRTHSGFAPTGALSGYLIHVGNGQSFFTATASDDTFTTPANHGLTAGPPASRIQFCAPYGETFPGGISAGQVYYVKSVPTGTTFTISATDGGATIDITSDGAGWYMKNQASLARVYWESLFLTLTVADVGGIRSALQQPAWTRNLRIEMDAAASAVNTAFGFWNDGQLSYHDNIEINTSANCTALCWGGVGNIVRGFNDNGVLSSDTALEIYGHYNSVGPIWAENVTYGIKMGRIAQSSTLMFPGPHYALRGITIAGAYAPASFFLGPIEQATTSILMFDDQISGRQFYSWDGGTPGTGETTNDGTFGGLHAMTSSASPVFQNRTSYRNNDATVTARRMWGLLELTGSGQTVNLLTTGSTPNWEWLGFTQTISNIGSGDATIDPAGAETINGASTYTLKVGESVTIVADLGDWNITQRKLPGSSQTYSASNVTTDRTYDANATTTDELADVLGTLISDLRARGLVI